MTASRFFSVGLIVFFSCLESMSSQQISNGTAVGFPQGGHFTGSEIESVQVNNGNLHVQIPLWSLPGRGVTPTAAFIYDSKGWQPNLNCSQYSCSYVIVPEQGNTMQMSINASSASATTIQLLTHQICGDNPTLYNLQTNRIYREPNGTKHHMIPDPITTGVEPQTCWQVVGATALYAADGSGWTGVSKTGGVPGVSDTNGNSVGTIDTMGRPNPTTGSYYDSTGTLRSISVTTQSVHISTHLCFPSPDPGSGDTCQEYSANWTVPHIITLPNGLTYTINYVDSDEGQISSITLPTGASISYEYSSDPDYTFAGKQVTKRTLTVGNQISIWKYSYSGFKSGLTSITTVTDPLNNQTKYTCTSYGSDYTYDVPMTMPCHITKEQYYKDDGTLVKTVDIGYGVASLPTSWTTTWAATNQVSKSEVDYETITIPMFPDGTQGPQTAPITWGNISEKREYTWGSGAPSSSFLRRTTYSYLHTDTTVNPNSNQALYLAANIADRPTAEVVRDGAGNIISQTKYYYDEGSLIDTSQSPAVQHDYARFGAANKVRGNLTRVSHWLNTTGAWIDTSYTYDDLGNKRSMTDPGGHTTTYDYADRFSGASCNTTGQQTYALPTLITDAKGYRKQNTYYQCTSQMQNTKDENDLVYGNPGTSYTYDLVNRLLTTTHSDGGSVSTLYQDSVPLQATTTTTVTGTSVPAGVTPSMSHVSVEVADRLGRIVQTQSNNPEGVEYVDTTYDLLGRVQSVSNPHHSTANPTLDGTTTYGYDSLGRQTAVTHPDNSVFTTEYYGSAVHTTDEGNGNGSQRVERINDFDGLGRLVSVCEVSMSTLSGSSGNVPVACGQAKPGTGFLSTYQYSSDSSGNSFVKVLQTGLQTRSFTYDSLARLTSTFNPEAGTTTDVWTVDNLLYQRQRPKANQTGSVVTTTTYGYDTLHRLTSESYDDGVAPGTSYCYDETSIWGRTLKNTYGRKTRSLVGASCTTPPGTSYTAGESYSYDVMGRIVANDQCTPGMCGTAQKTFDYAYHDHLGGELTATDGLGHTFTTNPDSAGRLLTATSSLQDASHPASLFSSATYGVFGLTNGNIGPSMSEIISQQNRGWTRLIQVSNPSSTGKITVSGSEQSKQTGTQPATQSTATISLSGAGRQKKVYDSDCKCFDWITDGGSVNVIVNGFGGSGSYDSASDTAALVASRLAASLNRSGSPVTATVSNSTVTITSKATGAAANYPISYSVAWDSVDWSTPAFSVAGPGAMSGGKDLTYTTVYDQGTATVTVNGHATTTPQWGSGSTSATVAQSIASAVNADSAAYVTASASNSVVTLTAKVTGSGGQYAYSASTAAGSGFSSPSFTVSTTGSSLSNVGYSVTVGHALNGDVTSAQDTVNGNWTYTYDEFNRLTAASNTATSLSWNYDRFGNRWNQNVLAGSAVATSNSFGGQNNRADGYSYDAAGNVLNDGINKYVYDAEGRITCTVSVAGGGSCTTTTGIHYVYDADGLRVAKYSGSTLTNQYFYNTHSQMITELNGSGSPSRGEVFARGTYLATYDYSSGATTFAHGDWQGTIRYRTNLDGSQAETCKNNPFGDGLSCTGSDPSNKHFTGQLYDSDTGLDYFGARYFSSRQGRFLTPDWSATPEAIPYGHFEGPQSLNLYAFVKNNPVTDIDVDGHLAIPLGTDGFMSPDTTFDPWNNAGKGPGDGQQGKENKGPTTPPAPQTTPMAQQQNSDTTLLAQNNPPPPPGNQTGSSNQPTINKDAIVQYADQHARRGSLGQCARYCRQAFEAGGVNTHGHPVDAKDWGPVLTRNGAQVVGQQGYAPQRGDVVVFAGSDAHPHGHIAIYDGDHWVSDFRQRNMSPYRTGVPPSVIYRFPDN